MGGTVSNGHSNDEMVTNLVQGGYIRSCQVERVFRAVDRADYVLSSHRPSAYRDLAWKHGNIHLSAPCIYGEVMELLHLEPGQSFLNMGSGTGYLSTMAGLILCRHGINHGIELQEDCLKFAYERLEEFRAHSLALDEFDFCEPLFIQGNCLNAVPSRQYDRVYCGAVCPDSREAFIRQFVRVGGVLVMPSQNYLYRWERVAENTWRSTTSMPVSFTSLVFPSSAEENLVHLPECNPLSLQDICRSGIRRRLLRNVWQEHPELETRKLRRRSKFSIRYTATSTDEPTYDNGDADGDGDGDGDGEGDGDGDVARSERHAQAYLARLELMHAVIADELTAWPYFFEPSDSSDASSDDEAQRKKMAKRENADSGIAEDSSDRSNPTRSNSETADASEECAMEVALGREREREAGEEAEEEEEEEEEPERESERKEEWDSDWEDEDEEEEDDKRVVLHFVNKRRLAFYLGNKIRKLPLPTRLKLYVHYNRQL